MKSKAKTKSRKPFPTHLLVFLAPATLVYTIFMIYPLFDSLRLSFYDVNEFGKEFFVGFQNFIRLFTNVNWAPRFWQALKNNFVFFLIHTFVQNPIGLLLAALLTRMTIKGKTFFRTVFFMPTMLSFVLVGFIWKLILSPLWGIAKDILGAVGLGSLFGPWLGLESSALITVSLISVWQYVGIPMMLFYAALISIPDELVEASMVDGANEWQAFWKIKFPILLPTIGIVEMLTFVGNFNAFDLVFVVQGAMGNPEYSTDLLGVLFYRTTFGHQLQVGDPLMGATVASMMFLIILTGVLLYMFVWQKRVTTYEL